MNYRKDFFNICPIIEREKYLHHDLHTFKYLLVIDFNSFLTGFACFACFNFSMSFIQKNYEMIFS